MLSAISEDGPILLCYLLTKIYLFTLFIQISESGWKQNLAVVFTISLKVGHSQLSQKVGQQQQNVVFVVVAVNISMKVSYSQPSHEVGETKCCYFCCC